MEPPKVEIEDLQNTSYAADPNMVAEVLYRSYHYLVNTDFDLEYHVISRVKIYKKDNASDFLDHEISTYKSKANRGEEKITSLKVV